MHQTFDSRGLQIIPSSTVFSGHSEQTTAPVEGMLVQLVSTGHGFIEHEPKCNYT